MPWAQGAGMRQAGLIWAAGHDGSLGKDGTLIPVYKGILAVTAGILLGHEDESRERERERERDASSTMACDASKCLCQVHNTPPLHPTSLPPLKTAPPHRAYWPYRTYRAR